MSPRDAEGPNDLRFPAPVAVLLAERLDLDELEDLATRVAGAGAPGHGGRRYLTLSSAFEGLVAADGAPWAG